MKRWALLAAVGALYLIAVARDGLDHWIAETDLPVLAHATSAEVRDRNGALLRAYTIDDGRWRLAVTLNAVDPQFVNMLLAYEDKRFFDHAGIDPIALLRATGQALRNGRIVSGGSTLTMQVARLLEHSGTGAWQGKLRQMRVALALERQLDKDQILSLYLLLAPYGGNIEGVRAASLAWLGKEPARLTPAESAFLVALPQAPESRRPDRNPVAARAARDRVLLRLSGGAALTSDDAQAALRDAAPRARIPFPQLAPHLSDHYVAEGGGRHDLTIDATLQRTLETYAANRMARAAPELSLAIVVADHTTGEVLASVGSPGYGDANGRKGFVDMTRALRSPGSTLKPLVYALAFDRGLAHPETLIADTPVQFGTYAPQNFDGAFRGDVRVAEALQMSLNIPVVRLTERIGPAHLMAALRKAGTKPELAGGQPGLAVSLGGVGLSLNDLVQLYATLAQAGRVTPLRWTDAPAAPRPQIVAPRAAWMVGHVLAGIHPPPASGPRGHVAFKTGTSYGHRDAWAVGFDGQYVVGVWTGRPDGTPVPGAFGADAAAPLLFEVFSRVRPEPVPLPAPPADTLLLPNAQLPTHLQRFRIDTDHQVAGVKLAFPPDGALLSPGADGLTIRVRDGRPPYSVLADGAVLATGLRVPEFTLPLRGPGFTTLSVIDSAGASDRVRIELR